MVVRPEDPASSRGASGSPNGAASETSGDLAEFEALFHTQYGALCEYIHTFVRSRDVAEELAQDVFARLWERHTRAPVSLAVPYLYTAARNRALTYLRRDRVARNAVEQLARAAAEYPTETVSAEIHADELAVAVEGAIAELPERCRLIFVMSRREGLSYAEIASALDIAVSTVETQISRALKQLRVRLGSFLILSAALQPVLELARRSLP